MGPAGAAAPVVFHYPSRVTGGVESLFARLAVQLAAVESRETFLVDHADGVQARAVSGGPVRLLDADEGPVVVPARAIVVTPLNYLFRVFRELRLPPDARVVLWSLHPSNAVALHPPVPRARVGGVYVRELLQSTIGRDDRRRLDAVIDFIDRAGALLFMDEENVAGASRALGRSLAPRYMPVLVPCAQLPVRPGRVHGPRRLGWLGRLSAHKVSVLVRLLGDIAALASPGAPIDFTIIGDGEARGFLEARLPRADGLRIRFAGTLVGAGLEAALASQDMLFAVGTSALEGARLGTPAVLLDECVLPVAPHGYGYRWLFEATDHTLGSVIEDVPPRGRRALQALMAEFDMLGPTALGARCHEHVERMHGLDRWSRAFLALLDASRATVAELGPLVEPGALRTLGRLAQRGLRQLRAIRT